MGLRENTHFTDCAYGQIHILRNAPPDKYTFYGMRLRANTHSTECAYEQIYILRNAHMGKYMHFMECAYGQLALTGKMLQNQSSL